MCGIAGVINAPSVSAHDLSTMIETIRYRGIDEKGVQSVGSGIIAHARLAVVDPEHGKQPMTNEDGTVWVTFNGEIYNFVALRDELKAKGYHFKSKCDTEILLHLWREEGEAMLSRLIGMFAFFLWDETQQRGILARDRQGIKPCFVMDYEGGIAFCSEIKGLLTLPKAKKEINDAGLKEVFSFNYCLPYHTCFKGINPLMPGTYLLFEGTHPPKTKRYWNWPFGETFSDPASYSYDAFFELLDDATRIQMGFDVKGGLYLSGGVDSAVVSKHLRKYWNEDVIESLSLDFPVAGFSEFQYAEKTANYVGGIDVDKALISYEMVPELARKSVYHSEQPHGDFSFILYYILSRTTREHGKIVMFNGDGPDETFGHNAHYFNTIEQGTFSLERYFTDVICYMPQSQRNLVLSKDFEATTPDPIHTFLKVTEPFRHLSPLEQILGYECHNLMPGNNLVKGDRMSGAWSTEIRSPLMDHRVSEFFTRLPVSQKYKDGYGKYYFKNYALQFFPHQHIFKQKHMPTMPIGEWIKDELYDWARDVLALENDYCINRHESLAMLERHKAGEGNYTRSLRTLLMTKLWLDTFF